MNNDELKYAILYMICFPVVVAFFFVTCLLLSGCGSHHPCMVVENTVLDSIVIRDTTFQVELVPYKDSISTPDTASFLCNPYAYSYASYSNGLLNHSLGIYPFANTRIKIPYFIERIRRVEVPKPYPVEKKLSRWERMKMDVGGYAIGAVVVTVLIVVGRMVYLLKKGK